MKITTLKFRDLDRHYFLVENLKDVKKIYKKLHIKDDLHPILIFSYINHETGIQFRVLGNIIVTDGNLSLESSFLEKELVINYDSFEIFDVKPVPKTTIEKIDGIYKVSQDTLKYYENESLINSREIKQFDEYRDLRLVDDIQFLLLTKEGQQKDVWARIESMDEKEVLNCTLLDKTNKEFGLKKNDKIYIKYVQHPKYKGLMFVKKA